MITPSEAKVPRRDKNRFWLVPRFWIGIGSSGAFVWLVLRQVSWPRVLASLQGADWWWLFPGLLLMTVTWALFAIRWQILLAPRATVPWSDSFSYILVGYLGNAVLPLRLGDVGRIVLITKKHATSIVFTSATVVLERLFDILTVVTFIGLLMLVTPIPELIRKGVQVSAMMAVVAFVALALLSRSGAVLARLETLASTHLPQVIVKPFFVILHKLGQGLQVATNLRQLLRIASLSVLSWSIAGLSILCFVKAFQLAVPWHAAILVLTVTNLGGAIPSSPGAIGVYEFLAVLALSVWISEGSVTVGFALVTHAANLAMSVFLGLIAAWREGIRLPAIVAEGQAPSESQGGAFHSVSSTSGKELWENSPSVGDTNDG